MGGNMIQKVVVNVLAKKKKTRRQAPRGGKKVALRGNNPLAYGNASSTNEFRIPTHTLQSNAPLLLPARTLDD